MKRLALLPLGLLFLVAAAPSSHATDIAICDRADVYLFHLSAHDRVAIRVRGLGAGRPAEFDGPGFHRVRYANRKGRAVLHVRPRHSGKASVTVQCNDRFRVRVTEDERGERG
ncbi:MAG TPA: hypothetical protein VGC98_09740 [Thermoleophilaceae bacterium]